MKCYQEKTSDCIWYIIPKREKNNPIALPLRTKCIIVQPPYLGQIRNESWKRRDVRKNMWIVKCQVWNRGGETLINLGVLLKNNNNFISLVLSYIAGHIGGGSRYSLRRDLHEDFQGFIVWHFMWPFCQFCCSILDFSCKKPKSSMSLIILCVIVWY